MLNNELLKIKFHNSLIAIALGALTLFILAVVYGQNLNYSPVPYADSWEGAINFYLESQGNLSTWWHQHFDHRIFFSKLIFWIDLRFFDGANQLYLPLHFMLMMGFVVIYMHYALKILPFLHEDKVSFFGVLALAGIISFSWMQKQNIVWEFQACFFLAYLLPLIAFYCFARAHVDYKTNNNRTWLISALVIGFASAYTMSNGIFVLPLFIFMGVLFKLTKKQLMCLILFSAASVLIFFVGYEKTTGRAWAMAMITNHPLKVLSFFLTYIGSPFYLATGFVSAAISFAAAAIFMNLYIFFHSPRLRNNPFSIALFTYILFVCAAAGLTALGRSLFPIEMAASSRYTTPALSFWLASSLLWIAHFNSGKNGRKLTYSILGVTFILLIKHQLSALYFPDIYDATPAFKRLAASSLKLEINDQEMRKNLYVLSNPADRDRYFERARKARISIFSEEYEFPEIKMSKKIEPHWDMCELSFNEQTLVDHEKKAYRVYGSLLNVTKQYKHIFFSNNDGIIKGVAFLGEENFGNGVKWFPRSELILEPINYSRFKGYYIGDEALTAYCF